jgi:exo-beta-1,3-glucanase (GH17 family)
MKLILLTLISCIFATLPYHSNAICYGPFRDGQSPGNIEPTEEELTEDLKIMAANWSVIRMYGSRGSTEKVLNIINDKKINLKIYLGAWIASESEDSTLYTSNINELNKTIELANKYPKIVEAIVIGNETQVFWTWNKVDYKTLKNYILYVKSKTKQPITTADDFNFWNKPEGLELASEIDFIMVHIHPLWAGTLLNDALPFVSRIYGEISILYPNKKIVIGETGWATAVHTEGDQAKLINGVTGIKEQLIFYNSINSWIKEKEILSFFFEAFDEKWKGGDHSNEVEKHWGLINSDRTEKHNFIK